MRCGIPYKLGVGTTRAATFDAGHRPRADVGASSAPPDFRALAADRVDAFVVGEGNEWEACEYAQEAAPLSGRHGGLVCDEYWHPSSGVVPSESVYR